MIEQTNPLTYQLLTNQIKDLLRAEKEEEQERIKPILQQIVGAEIIYASTDRFFIWNPRNHKRLQVKVGDWQIAPF